MRLSFPGMECELHEVVRQAWIHLMPKALLSV